MISRDDLPPTPDWHVEPRMAPALDEATRERLLKVKPSATYRARPLDERHLILGEN